MASFQPAPARTRGKASSATREAATFRLGRLPGLADVLGLQRIVGNQVVQRLIADDDYAQGGQRIFVPRDWMDTQIEDRPETVRQAIQAPLLLQELKSNMESVTGNEVSEFIEVNPPSTILKAIGTRRFGDHRRLAKNARERSALKPAQFTGDLAQHKQLRILPGDPLTAADPVTTKLIIGPTDILKAEADLEQAINMEYACAIIAIVKSQAGNAGRMNQKLNLPRPLQTDQQYYQAMHDHYFNQRHIEYDEMIEHPRVFKEWGFNMIWSGLSTFKDLPNHINFTLQSGKGYIFDITGHSVWTKMRRQVTPGLVIANELDYFDFKSDQSNFNGRETDRMVEYIYST